MASDRSVGSVPASRGLSVDVCDRGHQAIAFVGSCPMCRTRFYPPHTGSRPLVEGENVYAADLRRIIKAQVERL